MAELVCMTCGTCGEWQPGAAYCRRCGASRRERHAQIHPSERSVIFYNPATGERRTPARADQPMPEVYASQGFERREIMSMVSYEKETGLIHEASTLTSSSADKVYDYAPPTPSAPKEVIQALVDDVREAAASGPWTEREGGDSSFSLPVSLGQ